MLRALIECYCIASSSVIQTVDMHAKGAQGGCLTGRRACLFGGQASNFSCICRATERSSIDNPRTACTLRWSHGDADAVTLSSCGAALLVSREPIAPSMAILSGEIFSSFEFSANPTGAPSTLTSYAVTLELAVVSCVLLQSSQGKNKRAVLAGWRLVLERRCDPSDFAGQLNKEY